MLHQFLADPEVESSEEGITPDDRLLQLVPALNAIADKKDKHAFVVSEFKKINDIDELNSLYILVKEIEDLNHHRNTYRNRLWLFKRPNTTTWSQTISDIRQHAFEILKTQYQAISLNKDKKAFFKKAREMPIFKDHRANYILSGAFGRTQTILDINTVENPHRKWHTAISILTALANIFNIGIFVHMVIPLLPLFLPVIILYKVKFVLTFITRFADPLIYTCKSLNRLTRYIGRKNDVTFEEEHYGKHEWQDKADLGTLFLFLTAIAAFFIPPSIFPLQSLVGWTAGLTGISINLYFDEIHPAKKAKEAYLSNSNPKEDKDEIHDNYKQHHYEGLFYGILILSLALFLPSISIIQAYSLPTPVHTLFDIIAGFGSSLLVALNVLRFSNYLSGNAFYAKLPGLKTTQEAPPSEETPLLPSSRRVDKRVDESPKKSPVAFASQYSPLLNHSLLAAPNMRQQPAPHPKQTARYCAVM